MRDRKDDMKVADDEDDRGGCGGEGGPAGGATIQFAYFSLYRYPEESRRPSTPMPFALRHSNVYSFGYVVLYHTATNPVYKEVLLL